jgi:hypothetical protein
MPAVLLLKHVAVTATVARQRQGEAAGSDSLHGWASGDKEENCDNEVKKLKHSVFTVLFVLINVHKSSSVDP